ncbi:alpha-1,4-N-acetylglucosaminyltransferase-like [Rhinatrema bivittatum]|uniref:alpha-1,4-N-acetylglucosaminyltransferase-like n=1 Tax=Rhinatrema bivittatum TaxID=194408 RepID=UPI00112E747A|nr:alpha-1,4-N-acetylglucosaminyltransferase-like [Rhinatrema bivittatum]
MKHSWTLYRSLYNQPTVKVANIESNHGIFFAETTENLEVSSLVVCAIESASRTYPNRSIYFFMKGLTEDMTITKSSFYKAIPLLSSIKNVKILPLNFENVFKDTPLLPWYQKVNPVKESYWTHISSDGFRLAMIWKHGGIYMDTDIISMRPIQEVDFLAAPRSQNCSNGIFGFQRHYQYLWECMEDFVKNYNGAIWGQQGPRLLTRVLARQCELPVFKHVEDATCGNISILHPQRFYPIPYLAWRRYFEVWDPRGTFNNSYALHLWNFMNKDMKKVTAGSNTVAENLFIKYCPLTYEFIVKATPRK